MGEENLTLLKLQTQLCWDLDSLAVSWRGLNYSDCSQTVAKECCQMLSNVGKCCLNAGGILLKGKGVGPQTPYLSGVCGNPVNRGAHNS